MALGSTVCPKQWGNQGQVDASFSGEKLLRSTLEVTHANKALVPHRSEPGNYAAVVSQGTR